jgi:hypothetical protein
MTKDIIKKLCAHLNAGIDTECKVVYLLAQIRKILDRDDPQRQSSDYTALWMCCHWAVHPDLTSLQTTGEFLDKVDRWITNTVAYLQPRGEWSFVEEFNLFRDFIFLATIRNQLKTFLQRYNLPTDLCDLDESWHQFINAYGGVIEDGTLSLKTNSNPLGAVKQITFKKLGKLSDRHHVSFVIQWRIDLFDGRTLIANVKTVPDGGGNMTFHDLKIINNRFVPPSSTE